jgi:hypothetical protein
MNVLRRSQYLVVPVVGRRCHRFRGKTKFVDTRLFHEKQTYPCTLLSTDASSSETLTDTLKRLLKEHYDQERLLAIGGIATAYMWQIRRTILEEWDITEGEFVSRLSKKIRDEGKKVALYYDCRDFAPALMEPPKISDSSDISNVMGKGKGKDKKIIEVDEETLNKQQERLSLKVVITDRKRRSILINCICTTGGIGFEELGIIDEEVDFNKLFLEGCDIPDEKIRRNDIRRLPKGFHDAFFAYTEEELNFTLDLVTYVCLHASLHRRKKQIEFLEQVQDIV